MRRSAFGSDCLEFRSTVCSLLNVLLFVSFERFPNYFVQGEDRKVECVEVYFVFVF